MLEGKEIMMNVYDKRFGQNFVKYTVKDIKSNEIIDEGKCGDQIGTRKVYHELMDKYGEEKILLLFN